MRNFLLLPKGFLFNPGLDFEMCCFVTSGLLCVCIAGVSVGLFMK